MQNVKAHFNFELLHEVVEGKHRLWFITPEKAQSGFPSKYMEITEAQWDELRFHFGTAVDDVNKCEKLTYMIVNLMDDVVDAHQKTEGEAYMDIDSPSGTKVTVSEQSIRNGSDTYKIRANQHLKVGGVYTVDRTEIHNWYTEVILYEFPGVRFSSVQFVKPKDIIHIPYIKIKHLKYMESCCIDGYKITRLNDSFLMLDNEGYEYISDHFEGTAIILAFIPVKTADPFESAAEGEEGLRIAKEQTENINKKWDDDMKSYEKYQSIDYQIDWLKKQLCEIELGDTQDIFIAIKENLQAIKRWQESPVMKDVDCEKVIQDLIQTCVALSGELSREHGMIKMTDSIQNAEAALGMLQAFKKERGVKVPHVPKESTQFQHKPPGWVEKHSQVTTKSISEIHANERQMLVDEISKMLPVDPAKTVGSIPGHIHTANAIVFAIERYEQLKHKNR